MSLIKVEHYNENNEGGLTQFFQIILFIIVLLWVPGFFLAIQGKNKILNLFLAVILGPLYTTGKMIKLYI